MDDVDRIKSRKKGAARRRLFAVLVMMLILVMIVGACKVGAERHCDNGSNNCECCFYMILPEFLGVVTTPRRLC
jgi:hypothetical protein